LGYVRLKFCDVRSSAGGIATRFEDGAGCFNRPILDDAYRRLAENCGHEDPLHYCWEHDYCHAMLSQFVFDKPSNVLWAAAHGEQDPPGAEWEEKVVYYFQRFIHGNGYSPDPQWQMLRHIAMADMALLAKPSESGGE
jgi:hypothetical protein